MAGWSGASKLELDVGDRHHGGHLRDNTLFAVGSTNKKAMSTRLLAMPIEPANR